RLPAKPPSTTPARIGGIRDLAGTFDLAILDAWGVLNLGATPIATAAPAMAALRRAGIPLRLLSNDASGDKPRAIANHRRRGFDFTADELVLGLDLVPQVLAEHGAGSLGVIADAPDRLPDFGRSTMPLGDDPASF